MSLSPPNVSKSELLQVGEAQRDVQRQCSRQHLLSCVYSLLNVFRNKRKTGSRKKKTAFTSGFWSKRSGETQRTGLKSPWQPMC
jgi:hypothetical protein